MIGMVVSVNAVAKKSTSFLYHLFLIMLKIQVTAKDAEKNATMLGEITDVVARDALYAA